MTNEEKAKEIADNFFIDEDVELNMTGEECHISCTNAALDMAKWKDEQYRKEFNVPDYCESFEEISNYIGNDVFAKGYNKAKAYDRWWLKEYLEKKIHTIESMKDIDTTLLTDTAVVRTIKEIINNLFPELEETDNSNKED